MGKYAPSSAVYDTDINGLPQWERFSGEWEYKGFGKTTRLEKTLISSSKLASHKECQGLQECGSQEKRLSEP